MSFPPPTHVYEPRWFPLRDDLLSVGELKESWPSVRLSFEFGPWHWRIRPRVYADDMTHTYVAEWLGLKAELYGPDRKRR